MPTERTDLDRDDIVQRYLSGQSLKTIAQAVGASDGPIRRILRDADVPIRSARDSHRWQPVVYTRTDIDAESVIRDYLSGESQVSLAAKWSVSVDVIRRMLVNASVPIRSNAAAQSLRMQRMTPEERSAHAEAMVRNWRGQRHTDEALTKAALARQQRGTSVSGNEVEMMHMLQARGLDPIPQLAVGKYNIDLAIGNVGVEILGGWWHKSKRHEARTRYLFDRGWDLIFVWVHRKSYPLRPAAADYVVAYVEEAQRHPAPVRQYRMIRGTGKEVARGSADLDHLPGIPADR